MRVLAERPGGYYLVEVGDERGCIVHGDTVYEPHSLAALEARGYWEDFTGDPAPILALVEETYFSPR